MMMAFSEYLAAVLDVPMIRMSENTLMTRQVVTDAGQSIPLLLIDDDRSLASLLMEYCIPAGFSIHSALSGEDGLLQTRQRCFSLIILDVSMPGIDGFEVLKRLREFTDTPILMLTTRDASVDRVRGLESGADDYLAKPFQPEELIARIKSILRRVHRKERSGQIVVGDLAMYEAERSLLLSGQRLDLTGAEYGLLRLLLLSSGEPLTREELIPIIFGREPNSFDRSIDNLVNNLRRKLGTHPDGSERIKSVRNVGYCYVQMSGESGT
ncbi:response regulator transcription factor [Terriglobus roseus]|uniref:Two component transcriptional regulator, winged helix family n=1 Tax=Terriglobus roseus TaxID=392734 RepID=A0A1G7FXN3_9BACT|nr:response regulator transcription factor [Terriglobus roseus]SDE80673.1 two component transcriptional regulator, winged helix family [Terriglobus roseus]